MYERYIHIRDSYAYERSKVDYEGSLNILGRAVRKPRLAKIIAAPEDRTATGGALSGGSVSVRLP